MNIGIIGLGYWGKHYIRIVSESKHRLKAICAKTQNTLDKYSTISCNKYIDYKEMFDSEILDSIIIATPANTHFNIINDAIKKNIHILTEKPYTMNLIECNNIGTILKKNTKLMIGHTFLYCSKIEFIKKYITHYMFNKSTSICINFEWTSNRNEKSDENPIYELAIHPISIIFYIFPNIEIIDVKKISTISKNTYFIIIQSNNIIINLNISWKCPEKIRKMVIHNENIKIIFDNISKKESIKICSIDTDSISIPKIEESEPLKEQFNNWINYILFNEEIVSDHSFSCKVIGLCEKILN